MEPTHLLVIEAAFTLAYSIPPHVGTENVLRLYREKWPAEIIEPIEPWHPYSEDTLDAQADGLTLTVAHCAIGALEIARLRNVGEAHSGLL